MSKKIWSTGYRQQSYTAYNPFGVQVFISYTTTVGFYDESAGQWLWDDHTYSNTTARHIAEFCGMNKRERRKDGCSVVEFGEAFILANIIKAGGPDQFWENGGKYYLYDLNLRIDEEDKAELEKMYFDTVLSAGQERRRALAI